MCKTQHEAKNVMPGVTESDLTGFTTFEFEPPERLLIDRAQRGDPTVTMISMNQGGSIKLEPDVAHTIFTFGLCGCQAVAVASRTSDGGGYITLTHYDPGSTALNINNLSQLRPNNIENSDMHESVILLLGDWVKTAEDKWQMKPSDKHIAELLDLTLKSKFGEQHQPAILAYSESIQLGESRAFILEWDGKRIKYSSVGHHYGTLLNET